MQSRQKIDKDRQNQTVLTRSDYVSFPVYFVPLELKIYIIQSLIVFVVHSVLNFTPVCLRYVLPMDVGYSTKLKVSKVRKIGHDCNLKTKSHIE